MSDTSEIVQEWLDTLPSDSESDATFCLNYSESEETGWSETESEAFTEVSSLSESESSDEETLYKIGPMYCDGSERLAKVEAMEKIKILCENDLV